MQPAAAWVPLRSRWLELDSLDQVLLVATDRSRAAADTIKTRVRAGDLTCPAIPADVHESNALTSADPALQALIQKHLDDGWLLGLLANGATMPWLQDFLDWVPADRRKDFTVFVTRGAEGLALDGMDGHVTGRFLVPDIGVAALLDLLSITYASSSQGVPGGTLEAVPSPPDAIRLERVLEVHEHAGELYVAIDAAGMELPEYRHLLNWAPLQQRLGLELRRLVLVSPPNKIRQRTIEDALPVVPEHSRGDVRRDLDLWRRAVVSGKGSSWPERQMRPPGQPRPRQNPSGPWDGTPLIVTVGTQPASTLQAIQAHRPGTLVLLYDRNQPRSIQLASVLTRTCGAQCKEVRPIDFSRDRGGPRLALREWRDLDVDVNVTPGDAHARAVLQLWARERPDIRSCWRLQGAIARPFSGPAVSANRADLVAEIDLKAWVDVHTPQPAKWAEVPGTWSEHQPPPPDVADVADELATWMARRPFGGMPDLSRLWSRRDPPLLRRTGASANAWTLTLPSSRELDLAKVSSLGWMAEYLVPVPARGGNSNGRWLEWVVGVALWRAGIDEVRVSLEVPWPGQGNRAVHRDELDVVSRSGGQVALWSVKSRNKPDQDFLVPESWEARAQADRLLGRSVLSVLVLPRLREAVAAPFVLERPGLWRMPGIGYVVDARTLVDRKSLLELAGRPRPR